MDSKDWNMLNAIYEEGSLVKAAKRLYISQPALTYRLQKLQGDYNVKILFTKKNKIQFTVEGEYLVHFARKMIREEQLAREYVRNLSDEVQGVLKMGSSTIFARYKLPGLLKEFLKEYPKVDIELTVDKSHQVLRLLQDDQIHIAFESMGVKWAGSYLLMGVDDFSVISHKKIQRSQLKFMPRIHYALNENAEKMIEQWWWSIFSEMPKKGLHVDDIETCKEMVKNHLGYAFVPHTGLSKTDDFYILELEDNNGQKLQRNTWLKYRDQSLQLTAVKAFVEFVKNWLNTSRVKA